MKRLKNVGAFIVFQIIGVHKLPFTLISSIMQGIEILFTVPMVKVAKFGSPWFRESVNDQLERNADSCDCISEFMRELKIES